MPSLIAALNVLRPILPKPLIATFVLTVLGILAVFGVYGNWLGLQDALGIDGNTLLVAVVPLIVVTFIVYFVVRSDINKKEIKK